MLGFKRVCRVAWTGSNGLACNVFRFALHVYSKFVVGRRNAFILVSSRLISSCPRFPRFLGFAFSPAWFPFRVCTVLALGLTGREPARAARVNSERLCSVYAVFKKSVFCV